jgi:aconitate hydratase
MRLPDIVGVKLTGQRQPGITATDIVLALTEFLRKERGRRLSGILGDGAASLTIGDRATISNMARNMAPPPRCSTSTSKPSTTSS